MLYIYCGTNITQSREEFVYLKKQYRDKGYDVLDIDELMLGELDDWLGDSGSLYAENRAFFAERILSKKKQRDALKKAINRKKDMQIVVWEDAMPERDIKRYFKKAVIKAHNLPTTIFKLLDSLYPPNLKSMTSQIEVLSDSIDENILLYMMQKRIKELIIVSSGETPGNAASWQISRLKRQAQRWRSDRLISLYDKLFQIERATKTGQAVYSIKQSLEILLIIYLR
ncbi:MAG: hypothetical protein ACE5DQ_02080 [Candidatus Paceibacterota bacterium]